MLYVFKKENLIEKNGYIRIEFRKQYKSKSESESSPLEANRREQLTRVSL